uniref:Uncharacterized protein n=1 Tax=Salix viminalis TaxID=40686 RepID=A0A6N2MST5_SALVM
MDNWLDPMAAMSGQRSGHASNQISNPDLNLLMPRSEIVKKLSFDTIHALNADKLMGSCFHAGMGIHLSITNLIGEKALPSKLLFTPCTSKITLAFSTCCQKCKKCLLCLATIAEQLPIAQRVAGQETIYLLI